MTCLDPFQTLEDHYWDSPLHPKCKPCALGFENLGKWTEHKISCPVAPLGSRPAPNNSNGRAAGTRPTLPSPQPVTGPAPNTFGSTSLAGIAVSVASSTSSSEDGFRSTYSPGHLPNAHSNGAGPSRFAPTPTGGVPARAEAAVAETNGTTSFSCSKCKTQYASQELLQQHFNQSTMHHTCKTCGLGFETAASWATHRGRCPPPGSYKADAPSGPATTDGPVAIEPPAPDPARTPQADHAALRPQPTEPRSELGAPEANPSAAMMLASTMMLPSEDGRSPAASVSTSRASTPISVLRSTASSGPSVGGPASFYTPALSSRSVSNYVLGRFDALSDSRTAEGVL
ncbi:hypothetical protein BD311DRAFT_744020 [Dichomitus squalens]|uniref:Uncharacterized protein n=1 Tax=Dichomitus squalens TaxID=114155 RepID=A0A4Q9N4C0_9APHY|nr:hypothetical protein BD311DRAFT_744020 [Dichomitus squalens]